MSVFTFKRGPIRSNETWTLSGKTLSREGETVHLPDVTEVMFEQAAGLKGIWVTGLKLKTDQKTHSLQCNDTFGGPQRQQFIALCTAVIGALEASGAEINVRKGKGTRALAWVLALSGAVLILGALFMLYFFFDRSAEIAILIFSGVLFAMGVFMIWSGAPWQKTPERTLHDLHQHLIGIQTLIPN